MTEMTTANPLLSKLNKQQREAAMYTEGLASESWQEQEAARPAP